MRLTVTPVAAVIGAEIGGVDLRAAVTDALRDRLRQLLGCHRVLFFRDQHLSTAQQIAFAEAFGPILDFRSVVPADPHHPGVHDVDGSTVGWHLDASGLIEPPVATVLHAVEIPPRGGDTIWANGVAAYQGLPGELKQRLTGLYATHTGPGQCPIVAHPLVLIHPDTGERYLYLNLAPWVDSRILGMDTAESAALVDRLREHYLQPGYQVRFRWSAGTVVIWDNRVAQHTGIQDYGEGVRRRLKRICIARFTC
ncbi:TauD/TfdA dioxygenase family protein [Mycobacterium sp. pUA109]|uniref:TauD/TfdA dioxygenase family protein n=1 Tax=Mycobacterium sp. pUA109 TaxID=3238982 RepID=UPI00351B1A19